METVLAALVSAAAAIVVCIINHNRTVALMEYKIDQLTEQVKKHNNLVERVYECEKKIAVLEERVEE